MLTLFIKYFCLFFCSLYTSIRIANTFIKKSIFIFLALLLTIIASTINQLYPNQYFFFPFVIYLLITFIIFKNIPYAFIDSTISYGISYVLFTLSSLLSSSIVYAFHFQNTESSLFIICFISALLTISTTLSIFKIPRFKSGMPFLFQRRTAFAGLLFAFLMIGADIYIHMIYSTHYFKSFLIQLLACLLLIPFIAWWRSQLTKTYRQYLKDAETQELRAKVEQLTADNQHLSQIVHKDNKLITAMTSSVLTFVEEIPDYSPEHLSAYSRSLHNELLSLSSHRQDSLSRLSGAVTGQFHTGYMMLDSVLNLQSKQAREYNIAFSVESNEDFFTKIFLTIDEEQLTHIVADLVQNAIIATKNAPYKSVDIAFVTGPQAPSIQISDTGLPFPTVVLNSLGQERCSQHLHDGGSGIGLMDIWTLKNTARATLLIEEFLNGAKFTKRIHLIFDKKNRYIIISDRKDELSSQLHRPDVILLSSSH